MPWESGIESGEPRMLLERANSPWTAVTLTGIFLSTLLYGDAQARGSDTVAARSSTPLGTCFVHSYALTHCALIGFRLGVQHLLFNSHALGDASLTLPPR